MRALLLSFCIFFLVTVLPQSNINHIKIEVVGTDWIKEDSVVYTRVFIDGEQVIGPEHPFIFHNLNGRDLQTELESSIRIALTHRPFADDDPTLTVFPDSGKPGSTSVDGDLGTNDNTTYATAHSTADCVNCSGTNTAATENSGTKLGSPCNNAVTHFSVLRFLTNFDTSALTASATITAATMSVKPSLVSQNTHSDFIRITTNGGASNNDFTTADFGTFGTTAQANDINVSALVAGTYADFTFNSTGRGNISKTSVSKFGLRCGMDVNNNAPTPADSDCLSNSVDGTVVFWNTADVSGTGSDPKLVITYTLPGGAARRIFNIGS